MLNSYKRKLPLLVTRKRKSCVRSYLFSMDLLRKTAEDTQWNMLLKMEITKKRKKGKKQIGLLSVYSNVIVVFSLLFLSLLFLSSHVRFFALFAFSFSLYLMRIQQSFQSIRAASYTQCLSSWSSDDRLQQEDTSIKANEGGGGREKEGEEKKKIKTQKKKKKEQDKKRGREGESEPGWIFYFLFLFFLLRTVFPVNSSPPATMINIRANFKKINTSIK